MPPVIGRRWTRVHVQNVSELRSPMLAHGTCFLKVPPLGSALGLSSDFLCERRQWRVRHSLQCWQWWVRKQPQQQQQHNLGFLSRTTRPTQRSDFALSNIKGKKRSNRREKHTQQLQSLGMKAENKQLHLFGGLFKISECFQVLRLNYEPPQSIVPLPWAFCRLQRGGVRSSLREARTTTKYVNLKTSK